MSVGHFDRDAERRYFPVKAWSWNYVWAVSIMPSETHRVLPQKIEIDFVFNCTFLFQGWLCRRSTATASEVASLRRAKRDPHKASFKKINICVEICKIICFSH